jgi:hypothetical protein
MAHCRDGGRPSRRPVVEVVLPPLWHRATPYAQDWGRSPETPQDCGREPQDSLALWVGPPPATRSAAGAALAQNVKTPLV